jgi:hypothetical protein
MGTYTAAFEVADNARSEQIDGRQCLVHVINLCSAIPGRLAQERLIRAATLRLLSFVHRPN